MRYAGIDIASERHVVAIVDADQAIVLKATPFTEDAEGYQKILDLLGAPGEVLIDSRTSDALGPDFAVAAREVLLKGLPSAVTAFEVVG